MNAHANPLMPLAQCNTELVDPVCQTGLDIGCGPSKTTGAVGIDRYPFDGVDIVRDLMRGLPFDNDSFDVIIAKHVLEHFAGDDLMFLIEEMYRVSFPGAQWYITVHDHSSSNRYKDPDHKTRDWHEDSFALWEIDDKGGWPIFVGPNYDRKAKLNRIDSTCSNDMQRNRSYVMEVVK